jgi:hypothetical protein
MKRIINTSTLETVWSGSDYLVDGLPATVEPPLYLLTDVTRPAPDYDASTHRLQSVPAHADLAAEEWVTSSYEAVALSPADIAANTYNSDAAIAILTYAPVPSDYDADQLATFEPVRATLLAGLEALRGE